MASLPAPPRSSLDWTCPVRSGGFCLLRTTPWPHPSSEKLPPGRMELWGVLTHPTCTQVLTRAREALWECLVPTFQISWSLRLGSLRKCHVAVPTPHLTPNLCSCSRSLSYHMGRSSLVSSRSPNFLAVSSRLVLAGHLSRRTHWHRIPKTLTWQAVGCRGAGTRQVGI